jgi:hypothetical protein
VLGAVTLEEGNRLEVEKCSRRVGLDPGLDLRFNKRRKGDIERIRVDTSRELLRLLDGRSRMRGLGGEPSTGGFRLIGKEYAFEGVYPEDRVGLKFAVVKRIIVWGIES